MKLAASQMHSSTHTKGATASLMDDPTHLPRTPSDNVRDTHTTIQRHGHESSPTLGNQGPPASMSTASLMGAPKKNCQPSPKISAKLTVRKTVPSRSSDTTVVAEKSSSLNKPERVLAPVQHAACRDDATTHAYTYAASSSSSIPRAMMLNRHQSLLPIVLRSSCCLGRKPRRISIPRGENDREEQTERTTDDDDYYYLLDYKHLIARLAKPIIRIIPRYGQDDFGILFRQLDHIRDTMPGVRVYESFARRAP